MVVRNVVRSPVRAVVQSVFGEGESFHPFQLFTSGAQGAWYDPSDFSTLYQDAAGTTPVTAVEQPVRLMLDRSRGLVPGSELRGSAAVGIVGSATVATYNTSTGAGTAFRTDASNQSFVQLSGLTSTSAYVVTVTCVTAVVGMAVRAGAHTGSQVATLTAGQTLTVYITGQTQITFTDSGSGCSFTVISVRELPGNHAVAPNDASRPVLRSRYNLLTRSEEFDDAAWTKSNTTVTANAAVAPGGTMTAEKIIADNTNNFHQIEQGVTVASGTTYTFSAYVKKSEYDFAAVITGGSGGAGLSQREAVINLATGALVSETVAGMTQITALANGWYRVAVTTAQTSGVGSPALRIAALNTSNYTGYTGDGISGILIWGAQLLTAADHAATGGAYQRIAAATDYDTGPPWRPYLAFDGSDDSMSTSSIDFSGTDKMTVFAGVTKLSDAALGIVAEFSADSDTTAGTFAFAAPASPTTNRLLFTAGGTTRRAVTTTDAAYNAPVTLVLTGLGDISGDATTLRANGVQVAQNTGDQGTGNFANAALFIGRRNNTSFPLNGRLYGLTVLGRTATAAELGAMETWMAGKTGVSL